MLLDHNIDLGVVIEPFDDDRFIKNIVYESEAVLVVSESHRFSQMEEIDFPLLKDEKFLQISEKHVSSAEEIDEITEIDYEDVHKRLAEYRESSLQFLRENLK